MFENENTVPIFIAGNEAEEIAVCDALEEADISYIVQEYEDHAYDGLFTHAFGYSRVAVLEHDLERALQVIEPVVERLRRSENEEE